MPFGKTSCIGIEISDTYVYIAELFFSKHKIRLSKMVDIPLESGLVVDGGIQNPEELGFVIREQLKFADIKTKTARVVVPSRYVVIRQISMPKLSKKDIRQAIEFELQHSIHLPFEEHVFDFVKLELPKAQVTEDADSILDPEYQNANQESYIIVAAERGIVERLVTTMEIAGLKPKSVDVRALALYRLYAYCSEQKEEQTTVFVDISEQGTDIHIFRGAYLLFTRNVPVPLANYRKSESISYINNPTETQESDAIDTYVFVQDLSYEIERSINFYQYSLNNRDQQVSRIILTGIVPDTDLLLDYFKNRFDHTFTLIPSEAFAASDPAFDETSFRKHALAIGLAIREDKRIWK